MCHVLVQRVLCRQLHSLTKDDVIDLLLLYSTVYLFIFLVCKKESKQLTCLPTLLED